MCARRAIIRRAISRSTRKTTDINQIDRDSGFGVTVFLSTGALLPDEAVLLIWHGELKTSPAAKPVHGGMRLFSCENNLFSILFCYFPEGRFYLDSCQKSAVCPQ